MESKEEMIQRELECAICCQQFVSPRYLPCLHTFCSSCLDTLCQKKRGNMIACPLCRQNAAIPAQGQFPVNFFAENISQLFPVGGKVVGTSSGRCVECDEDEEDNEGTTFCKDCGGHLCDAHSETHKKMKKSKTHELISKKPVKKVCGVHPKEEIKLFCLTCQRLICRDCIIKAHKDHNYDFVEDVAAKEKEDLKIRVTQLKQMVSKLQRAVEEVQKTKTKLNTNAEAARAAIEEHAKQLIAQITQLKNQLQAQVAKEEQAKRQALEQQENKISHTLVAVKKSMEFIQMAIQGGEGSEIMEMKSQMETQEKQVKAMVAKEQLQAVEDETLEYIADKKYHTTIALGVVVSRSMTGLEEGEMTLQKFLRQKR
eukprot:TRINITY_DN1288_c0_g3_i1.p1 TRINITY_DN1288_c0_g3~~TRINITY_DN1288_c0_g3_i1.p1  ORF type:complete len:370 (+),score=68.50 TRINITY_DN1288_c0_g3_i1:46-1155(+)